jgi:hypothetical protein
MMEKSIETKTGSCFDAFRHHPIRWCGSAAKPHLFPQRNRQPFIHSRLFAVNPLL